MTNETLFSLSGLSLVTGGLLATTAWLLFAFLDPAHQQTEHKRWLPLNALIIAGGLFMALGLPGFYARQAHEAGILGLVGFVLLFTGIVIPYVAVHSIETAAAPDIPPRMRLWVSVGAPSLFSGLVIMGVATWRAGIYPELAGILLLLSAVAGLFTMMRSVPPWLRRGVLPSTFSLTVVWLGVLLMGQ